MKCDYETTHAPVVSDHHLLTFSRARSIPGERLEIEGDACVLEEEEEVA